MAALVTYELDGRVATITMDDGKVNVFSIPMLQALHETFEQGRFKMGRSLSSPAAGATSRQGSISTCSPTVARRSSNC